MIALPVADSPVNVIASTPGCRVRNSPAESGPKPCTRLNTPVGHAGGGHHLGQQRRRGRASPRDGFTTTVLPQASAGATFQVSSSSGRFHGTMIATTPTGLRTA